jgi:hypothetical protein
MSDQPNSQAANVNPGTARQANVLDEEDWLVKRCPLTEETDEPPTRGFLQLCADRRFHKCIQERFQEDAELEAPDQYWIHADAGGTPRRALLVTARRKVADYPGATHYIFRDNGAGGGQKICGCAMPGMPGRYGLV